MSILNSLIGPVTGLLDKFIEDKDGQLDVNKVEAAHKNLFVAGWRPAVGWVCCLGMAGNFLIIPLANFALALSSSSITIPLIETSEMMPVLMGMLGLGAMRTVEKTKNVQRERWKYNATQHLLVALLFLL
jgi:hypothetical protein